MHEGVLYELTVFLSDHLPRGIKSLHLNNCHIIFFYFHNRILYRFADTFDDVISTAVTAVATGALGSGTASLALRGGVVA